MKYPIDHLTAEQLFGHLIAHHRALETQVAKLTKILSQAMSEEDTDADAEWYRAARLFIKEQKALQAEHETRIFNEKNGRGAVQKSDTESVQKAFESTQREFTPYENARANDAEKSFGEEMTEDDLEAYFKEKRTKKQDQKVDMSKGKPFENMTLDEINAWEAEQNNSNDKYKVKARVANLARAQSGGNITPVGEMLVNTYVHVLMDFYKYAATLDKEIRYEMIERIRKHEDMPGKLIAATMANVKVKKQTVTEE